MLRTKTYHGYALASTIGADNSQNLTIPNLQTDIHKSPNTTEAKRNVVNSQFYLILTGQFLPVTSPIRPNICVDYTAKRA